MGFDTTFQIARLGDLGEFKNGANFSQDDYGPGFPIINVKQLYSGRYVSTENLESLKAGVLKRPEALFVAQGDILFARSSVKRSGAGQCALVPAGIERTVFSGFIIRFRLLDRTNADSSFLAYALGSPIYREVFQRIATGTTISNLSQAALGSIEISLPPLEYQIAISRMLGLLDDRIDNLRQTNTTLEAIAQALFKSWFVDFDPVHAKSEGRAPEAMDAATAALFPSEFEQSELGLIPKSWCAGTLDDLSHLNANSWSSKRHPDDVIYVDLSGVHENRISTVKELPYSDAPSRARRSLQDGDTIVGTVRPGNRVFAYIHHPATNLTGSTGFAVLSPKDEASASFVYLAATRNDSIERLTNLADGGAYPAVRPNVVSATPVVIPPESIVAAFSRITAPMLRKIGESRNAEATLVELRDTLLPRLISGKLRLPEARELAGADA